MGNKSSKIDKKLIKMIGPKSVRCGSLFTIYLLPSNIMVKYNKSLAEYSLNDLLRCITTLLTRFNFTYDNTSIIYEFTCICKKDRFDEIKFTNCSVFILVFYLNGRKTEEYTSTNYKEIIDEVASRLN